MSFDKSKFERKTKTTVEEEGLDLLGEIEEEGYWDQLENMIEKVKEDHTKELTLDIGVFLYKVIWNEKTDSVWIQCFPYRAGIEVKS